VNEKEMYGVLGLDPGAGPEEVKTAFRYLSKKYHPDTSGNPATSRRFVRVVKAYKVLNQTDRKSRLLRAPVKERFSGLAASDDIFQLGALAVASPDPDVRRYAVRRLGFSGRKAAYVFLRQTLSDSSEGVVEAAVRSIADLSLFQAAGEITALFARATPRIKKAILDAADATGESLFRATLEYAVSSGGPEGLRARRILADAAASGRAGA
jgi:hypothetical protein